MTPEEQYTRILEGKQDQNLIPFLQALSPQERKTLAPHVKKLGKEYLTHKMEGNRWIYKATDRQRTILYYSFFACYSLTEIKKEDPAWLISREHLEKFLPWYAPPWLNDYINGFSDKNWLPFQLDYGYLVELEQRGFIQPNPQLVARLLVPFLYVHDDVYRRQNRYAAEQLTRYAVTLEEHIWFLFQFETTIHFSNTYVYYDGKKEERGWVNAFQHFIASGKIGRQRLLQEALLAANRNFNKNLSGWFAGLFVELAPAAEELLLLQPELFHLFASPHGKVVGTALQACKAIAGEPFFDSVRFLDQAPLLLSSSTRSVVASALQLLEKLAKREAGQQALICQLATGALVHKEENLQVRAARLIRKFGGVEDEALRAALAPYSNTLYSGAGSLLQAYFVPDDEMLPDAAAPVVKGALDAATALPSINNPDEFLFLAAQTFDNNQSWHIDLLPAAMIRLQQEIRGEQIQKFEPAIQRALKIFFGDWRSNQGQLDHLMACLFLDYCLLLMQRFPWHGSAAMELLGSYMNKTESNKKVWEEHGARTTFFNGWKAEGPRFLCSAYRALFEEVLLALKENNPLPLLCEPTHAPAWIDPLVLVERLAIYCRQNAPPRGTDLQIALSRCWLHSTTEAIRLANGKLQGEIRQLMLFLLDQEQRPVGPLTMEAAWMMAALSKSPATVYPELAGLSYSRKPREQLTGRYPYKIVSETYTYDHYKWINNKRITEQATAQRKMIRFEGPDRDAKKPEISGFRKFLAKFSPKKEEAHTEPPPLLYDYLRTKEKWLSTEDKDIRRIYLLTPNNPEPLLALMVEKCLFNPDHFAETAKRFVVHILEVLHETWQPLGEMAHLVVAICFTCPEKTAVSYAAEIWLRGVEEGSIDSCLLGTILGKLACVEFAPLKRLTDLLAQQLLGVSPLHNRMLETVLSALLKELPAPPVRNLKKLLEIYLEVLRLNASSTQDEEVRNKLQGWKQNAALSKLLKEVI